MLQCRNQIAKEIVHYSRISECCDSDTQGVLGPQRKGISHLVATLDSRIIVFQSVPHSAYPSFGCFLHVLFLSKNMISLHLPLVCLFLPVTFLNFVPGLMFPPLKGISFSVLVLVLPPEICHIPFPI